MRHIERMSATGGLLQKAASLAVSHTFPAWIEDGEHGLAASSVIPRVRDNLVLRLVAGRRQEREHTLIHANGAH